MRKRSSIIAILGLVFAIGFTITPITIAQEQQQATTTVQTESEVQRAVKADIQKRRVDRKTAVKAYNDKFSAQVKNIKDEVKREALIKINEATAKINENRIDHYLSQIGVIESILMRVDDKITQADREGRPVGKSHELVGAARLAITTARGAVMGQSGTIYNLEAGDEGVAKIEAQKIRDLLFADLGKVQAAVKEAKQAVVQVIIEFNNAK